MARFGSVGRGFGRLGAPGKAESGPRIELSAITLPEDTATSTEVFTASIIGSYTGTPAYTLAGDDAAYFSIDSGTGVVTLDAGLDYEDDASLAITIEVADITPEPDENPRAFVITVTNVLEVTLNALGISVDAIEEGSPEDTAVGTLTSTSAGSTLSLTDDAGGKFKLVAGAIVAGATPTTYPATEEITVRETNADATNTPRDSVIEITVLEEGSVVPDAPVLTWTESGYEFEIVLDNPQVGDYVRYKVSDEADMSNILDTVVDELDSGEISAGEQNPALDDELADGTYYVTAAHSTNGVNYSAESNIEEIEVLSGGARQFQMGRYYVNVTAEGQRQYQLGRFYINE
jgi:hypothetical protein